MTAREIPIAEAAAQLGVTPEALRQRLKRGKTLRGTRRSDGWYVWLDGDQQVANGHDLPQAVASGPGQSRPAVNGHERSEPDATVRDPSQPFTTARPEQDSEQDTEPGSSETKDAAAPLVDQLQSEVLFLRGQVEALQERLREAHILLAQRPALPAGVEDSTPAANAAPARPWWVRWRAWWRLRDG